MLSFRNTNIFFIALLGALIYYDVQTGVVPWYAYVLLVILYSLVVFYGCIYLSANFFLKTYCSAKTSQKQIAISFDDGPAREFTPELLSLLKNENIAAAFFCIGKNIAGNEPLLKQADEEGHLIGNHSYSHHAMFDLFSSRNMLGDMQQMDAEAQRVVGKKPRLFRPPYGVINPNLKSAIEKGGYATVGWSVRSFDTVAKEKDKLLAKITGAIRPGAVFLFHDHCRITLEVLPKFIKEVKERGYEFVRLDKLLNLPPYA